MAHPNADLLRDAFAAMMVGDTAPMGELLADDATLHVPGTSSLSGDYVGKQDILTRWFSPDMPEWLTSWESEIHAILADDEHGVGLVKNTVGRDEKTYQLDSVFVCHIADGKLTEGWITPVDQAAFDAVWS
jgi:uncharacterized protein